MNIFLRTFLLALIFGAARAGVSPALTDWYAASGENASAPVLICLSPRIDAAGELSAYGRAGLTMSQAHERYMQLLQSSATSTQPVVRKSLEIMEGTGLARNVHGYWIANIISAELTRAGAELVANMGEVAEVCLDPEIRLLTRVSSSDATALSNNVELNLRAVGASDAWAQGLRGENQIVCVLGEGLNTSHPALEPNYLGKSAELKRTFFDPFEFRTMQYCGDYTLRALSAACGVDLVTGDTLGVAPAARWIGADIFVCGKSRYSTALAALEWAGDPDGNPSTSDDIAAAILCPWQLDEPCVGSLPQLATDVLRNVEALGSLLVFAASSGEGGAVFSGPASLAEMLSVGSVDARSNVPQIDPSSARGPSGCDARVIKPDLVAPGKDVRTVSRDVNSGYARTTGTAIAAAHVAGAAALMRQANPEIFVRDLKRALVLSAGDLGSPGADNIFGNGMLDISSALRVGSSTSRSGLLQCVVRYGGEPVEGARVRVVGAFGELYGTSNAGGAVRFDRLIADQSYSVHAGRFGYFSYDHPDSVLVPNKGSADIIINLVRGFDDDVEQDQGWSLGTQGDDATGGEWLRASPVGSKANGAWVQPGKAHGGKYCFVTGNAPSESAEPGDADVDGGRTTLRSPLFSLNEIVNPEIRFSYWYSNDKGPSRGDFFRAQVSNDGGANWIDLLNTSSSTKGWKDMTIRLSDFAVPSDNMYLQFIAEDLSPASLVEAAVDDIKIIGAPAVPEPPRDLLIDVQFDQVVLTWKPSADATLYKIYLSDDPDNVIVPERYLTATTDTTIVVPMSSIPYDQFYFQVTATR